MEQSMKIYQRYGFNLDMLWKKSDFPKVVVYATANILTPEVSEEGYLLLELTRSYLELDMFAGLTVHTDETLEKGEREILRFAEVLQVSFPSSYTIV